LTEVGDKLSAAALHLQLVEFNKLSRDPLSSCREVLSKRAKEKANWKALDKKNKEESCVLGEQLKLVKTQQLKILGFAVCESQASIHIAGYLSAYK
jgi:hypothetical protein